MPTETDLKAFERRLTEYIACLQPATGRWRMILIVVSVCTATGAWNWLIDPETQKSGGTINVSFDNVCHIKSVVPAVVGACANSAFLVFADKCELLSLTQSMQYSSPMPNCFGRI
ncbi:hypothetical protein EK904_006067 [Melospiza melodia maxima]|nr:hypothetical protein EK904_006067 [Melospiza melodia maxima]